jgi:PPP family 3-phenylpropionic acid transporter
MCALTKKGLNINRISLATSIYYALLYMAGGGYIAYIGLYYAQLHLDNTRIGLMISLGLFVGLLAQPVWGTISDRSRNKTAILTGLIFIHAAVIWLIPLAGQSFWLLIMATAVVHLFGSSIHPMGDSIVLEIAKKEGFKFSTVRFIGSVGFALMAAIAGQVFTINLGYIFLLFFIIRILTGLVSFFIPKVEGYQKREEEKDSFFELFKDRKLNIYYIFVFLLSITAGFFSAFHSIYSRQAGISTELIGLGVMIGSFSQFPFMIFFDWFNKKLGINLILIISGFVHVLRWFLYSFCLNSHTFLFIWVLHGMTFIVLYLCLADYVSHNVPKRLKTRGQMMNSIVLIGASSIIGGTIGGFFSDAFDLKITFFVCSIMCLTALAGFMILINLLPEFKKVYYSGQANCEVEEIIE